MIHNGTIHSLNYPMVEGYWIHFAKKLDKNEHYPNMWKYLEKMKMYSFPESWLAFSIRYPFISVEFAWDWNRKRFLAWNWPWVLLSGRLVSPKITVISFNFFPMACESIQFNCTLNGWNEMESDMSVLRLQQWEQNFYFKQVGKSIRVKI